MGIDLHAVNLIERLARNAPLGDVLTIGRQSMSVPAAAMQKRFGMDVRLETFCESFLASLGASSVESLDYSDYEAATHIADMGRPVSLGKEFDTIIDSGSLEHVFDVATAFRNVFGFCRVGGHVLHVLPVNNLSGHGFWQFSSDLMHSIYSEANGFYGTEVFYASSLDEKHWYRVPEARAGERVELVSIEPIVLLCISRKVRAVQEIQVMQPYYAPTWAAVGRESTVSPGGLAFKQRLLSVLPRGPLRNGLRNLYRVLDLCFGMSRYSLRGRSFEKIELPCTAPEKRE